MQSDQNTTNNRFKLVPPPRQGQPEPETGYDLLVYSGPDQLAPLNIASPLCWTAVKKLAFTHVRDFPGWVVRERKTGIELTLDEVTTALADPSAGKPANSTLELSR